MEKIITQERFDELLEWLTSRMLFHAAFRAVSTKDILSIINELKEIEATDKKLK
jgi:hypothetical protein